MVTHLVVETDKGEIIYCRTSTDNEAYMAAVKRIHREMGNRVIAVVRPKFQFDVAGARIVIAGCTL